MEHGMNESVEKCLEIHQQHDVLFRLEEPLSFLLKDKKYENVNLARF